MLTQSSKLHTITAITSETQGPHAQLPVRISVIMMDNEE
jgi:hypothetical protein